MVGGLLKKLVHTIKPSIMSEDLLWETLQVAYDILSEDRQYFIKLIESMPRRLIAVEEAGGGHTKY